MIRWEIDEQTAYIQARSFMDRTLEINGEECQAEVESKVVWWKVPPWKRTKIERDLFHRPWGHGIQRNHQERAWEVGNISRSCYALKLWKIVGVVQSNKIKTKLACILEADESTRMRMGNSIPHNHEDHIAGKGENSLQHYNLVHKFIPMSQAIKTPAAKAAVDKEWEKMEKDPAWNLTKVRRKKWLTKQGRRALQFILHH